MGKVMTTAKKLGSQGTLRKSYNLPSVDQSVNDPRDALSFRYYRNLGSYLR